MVGDDGLTVTGGDLKRKGLSVQVGVALPILAPIPTHLLPRHYLGTLNCHRMHVPGATHVRDKDQVEVRVAVDCEPYASPSHAGYPTITKKRGKI